MKLDFDPFSEEHRADPYPVYRALRDEAPVHRAEEAGLWVVSRYRDVVGVLKRPQLFSSDAMRTVLMGGEPGVDPASDPQQLARALAFAQAMPFEVDALARSRNLIVSDPPAHDELRSIVNRGFSPRRIAAWEPRLRQLVDGCLEKLRRGEPFDVVADLAVPVPVIVISELLGVEPERREDFKRWSDAVISGTSGSARKAGFVASGAIEAMSEFARYFVGIAERRRREPQDDLLSVLLAAEGGQQGLDLLEMVMFALVLLVAGNETTTNLIGSSVNALLDNPEQLDRVCRDPGLVPNLVEESLRYESPVQVLFRRAREPVEIEGVKLPRDAVVAALLGSANRDERQWGENAGAFDVARDTQGMLAFGFGVHFCLGASLARLEARCALEALVRELPGLRRQRAEIEYVDSTMMRGPRRLELARAA